MRAARRARRAPDSIKASQRLDRCYPAAGHTIPSPSFWVGDLVICADPLFESASYHGRFRGAL